MSQDIVPHHVKTMRICIGDPCSDGAGSWISLMRHVRRCFLLAEISLGPRVDRYQRIALAGSMPRHS